MQLNFEPIMPQEFPGYPATKALKNTTDNTLVYDYLYGGATPAKKLFKDSDELPGNEKYSRSAHPDAAPSSHGFWIKEVADQTAFENNYARIQIGEDMAYLFFKQVGSSWVLTQANDIGSGFDSTNYVSAGSGFVTASEAHRVTLEVSVSDGILIAGVLDDATSEYA
jgi:hypothetical protein